MIGTRCALGGLTGSSTRLQSGVVRLLAVCLVSTTLAAGCSSHSSRGATTTASPSTAAPTAPSPGEAASAGPSLVTRWTVAYDFVASQTKPTQISCGWFNNVNGNPVPTSRAALFYDFRSNSTWKSHVVTRNDSLPKGVFELCVATVPNRVPYAATGIERFLRPLGLTFAADPSRPTGLTPIEIAYAGQNASDPDVIYSDKPGLFGLRIALAQLGKEPFGPGTSKIIQPIDEQTAGTYLRYAQPLLDWYGFKA